MRFVVTGSLLPSDLAMGKCIERSHLVRVSLLSGRLLSRLISFSAKLPAISGCVSQLLATVWFTGSPPISLSVISSFSSARTCLYIVIFLETHTKVRRYGRSGVVSLCRPNGRAEAGLLVGKFFQSSSVTCFSQRNSLPAVGAEY